MAGPFAAAVFDLDGTLIDSEERSREAWLHVFESRGLPADEELIRSFIGRRGVDTRDLLLARLPDHDPAELMAATHVYFHGPDQPPMQPMPGAAKLVRSIAAADIPLGLVTSAGRRYAEESLVDLGVRELFAVVVTAGDVTAGKPDPEGYRAACRELGVAPAATVVFEDAPAGVAAAKAAGAYCVAVATSHGAAELSAADRVVPDLAAISWPLS